MLTMIMPIDGNDNETITADGDRKLYGHMTRNDDDEAEEEVLAVITYRLH